MTDSERAARLHERASALYEESKALAARGQRKKAVEAFRASLKVRRQAWDVEGRKPLFGLVG